MSKKVIGIVLFLALGAVSLVVLAQDKPDMYLENLSGHFGVSQDRLVQLINRGVEPSELPVILTISQKTGMRDVNVMTMRQNGLRWTSALKVAKLDARVFYFAPPQKITSSRFVSIFSALESAGADNQQSIELTDEQIVDLANVKFLSEYHEYQTGELINKRDAGASYESIATYLTRATGKRHLPKQAPAATMAETDKPAKESNKATAHPVTLAGGEE
jgi:hypothetical protein